MDGEAIDHLCRLSRISCTKEEKELFSFHLKMILEHVDQLKQIDTEGISPCISVLDLCNVFRDDEPEAPLERESFFENVPSHVGSFVKVPPILDKGKS